jgi:hypothetical protein
MSFLVDILRPTPGEGPAWYHMLKKASGGCNDLLYSGHMLVAVLTAMAWTVCNSFYFSVLQHHSLNMPRCTETEFPLSGATTSNLGSIFHFLGYCLTRDVIDDILTHFQSVSHAYRKLMEAGFLLQYGFSSCTVHKGRYVNGIITPWTAWWQSTSESSCGG